MDERMIVLDKTLTDGEKIFLLQQCGYDLEEILDLVIELEDVIAELKK
jgi:hypothetical protein